MDQHLNKRPAQRSRASLIVLIMLALLLMAAAIVLVVSLPDEQAYLTAATTTVENSAENLGFTCSAVEAQQMYPFAAGVMKLSGSRVAMLDIRGVEQYAVDVDFSAPFCVSSSGYFLAADRDGHSFVMLNSEGECYRKTLEGRISGAAIRDDGYLAIIEDRVDSTGVVSVFEPVKGTFLFSILLPESGYVLSVSFPPEGAYFDIALVNTSSSAAKPIVKRYTLEGGPAGQRIPNLSEIYPLIAYDADRHLVLCSAASLAALSLDSDDVIWQRSFQQIHAVKTAAAGLAVLATADQNGQCNLYLLKPDGQDKTVLPVGGSVTNLDVLDNLAATGCDTRAIVANLDTGQIVLDRNIAAEVIRVGFASNSNLTVVTRTGILSLSLN